ncbi:MAG: DUF2203 domain-containing protein [Actinomycetota bacterium]|nr:DUF2203 domain-containing protein [Actinomycetota bacterium]
MRHDRHYTLEEATSARGAVARMLATMREARDQLTDEEAREALAEASPGNGGGRPGRQVGEAFVALRSAAAQLQAMEVVVRDLDRGLVDFPSFVEGHEAYLCWVEREEDGIGYWHELDAGYPGRRPLPG